MIRSGRPGTAAAAYGNQRHAGALPPAGAADPQRAVLAVSALVAAAWLGLWVWSRSGSAYLLRHDRLEVAGLSAAWALMAGWLLMSVAMMLPASIPLVRWFHNTARRGRMVPILVGGYLTAWTLFGAAVHAGDWVLHATAAQVPWLGEGAWTAGPVVLVLAGLYQLTPLKRRCLVRCCALPRVTAAQWASEPRPGRSAFGLGVREGAWSIGCCWALMLLMVVAGMGSLAHMIALGAVVVIEQNVGRSRRLSAPLGMTLVLVGIATLVLGTLP
jgi:predicted metal-binding membrane protein